VGFGLLSVTLGRAIVLDQVFPALVLISIFVILMTYGSLAI